MLTLKEILKADPKDVPISEYEQAFKFLGRIQTDPGMDDDDARKQSILFTYRIYNFLKSTFFVTVIFCSSYIYLIFIINIEYLKNIGYKSLSIFWPWNINQVERIHFLTASGELDPSALDDMYRYLAICSATSAIWLLWIFWRLYKDTFDPGLSFFQRGNPKRRKDIYKILIILFSGSVLGFFMSTRLFSESNPSLFIPYIHDSVYFYALKKCIGISGTYILLGLLIFLSISYLRQELRRRSRRTRLSKMQE